MTSDSETLSPEAFQRVWNTLHFDSDTIALPPDRTLRPPDLEQSRRLLDTLPTLAVAGPRPGWGKLEEKTPYLEVQGRLGEGGSGLVHLARQVPLGREVALKSLKTLSPEARLDLLREARVTGLLEHPNIVPVYTLGQNQEGMPLLVMKRVEGQSWADLLAEDRVAPGEGVPADRLEEHLHTLLQVCQAMAFAHDRGVLHRDLKPANVMIGRFGEVYVLDWGLAVVSPERAEELGIQPPAPGVAGTPSYMAPEMLSGNVGDVSEQTDVYLLGATLYEVLTGRCPHEGSTLYQVMQHAWDSPTPQMEGSVPRELQELVRDTLHRQPTRRPAGVVAFMERVQSYLQHRESVRLADEAGGRLAQLQQVVAEPEEAEGEPLHLFTEARFGFQQALRMWPENQPARQGLDAAIRLMVRHEISRRAYQRASTLFAELSAPDEELGQALATLHKELEEEALRRAVLEQLEHDVNPNVAIGFRTTLVWVLAVVFFVIPSTLGVARLLWDLPQPAWLPVIALPVVLSLMLLGLAWHVRHILSNRLNRQFIAMLVLVFVGIFLNRLLAWRRGDAPLDVIPHDVVPVFVVVAGVAICLDARLTLPALAVFLAGIATAVWPLYGFLFMGVGAGTAMTVLGLRWRRAALALEEDARGN